MRVYLPPAVTQLISTAVVLAAIAAAGFLGFKAWETWTSDPSLNQIPGILDKSESK